MESRIEWLRTATALFLAWSFLTFLVRVWVKAGYTRNWGWSDSTIAVAFVVATAHVATVFHAINYGFGSPIDSVTQVQRETFETSLYAGSILYVIAVGFSKCSTALFIASLTRYGPQIRLAYVMTGVAGLWTVASLLVIALRGSLSQPWMTLDGSQPVYIRWIVIESTGLIVEAMLFGLAISLVWRLNMPLRRRTLILMAFGCRLLLTPLVALRLYFLSPAKNSDPTVSGIVFGIFTEAALQYSLVSASATCLKPFLQPLHSGHLVTSIGQPGSGFAGTSNVSYDPYYKLSTVGVQDKDGPSTPSTQKDTPSGGGRLRPDFSEFSATAEGGHESPESVISRDQDSRSMVIKSSKTFLVSKVKV